MTVSAPEPQDVAPKPREGVDEQQLPDYVVKQLAWYATYMRSSRIGYYILELLAIGLAAAVPVATTTGAATGVIAVLGSAAAAVGASRHVFGFDRNWTARAVIGERIKARAALFGLGQIDAPQLVAEVAELVERETAGWSYTVRAGGRAPQRGDSTSGGAHD